MVVIILVSHSRKITDGLKEMIEEMTGQHEFIRIISAGGTEDGRIGTDPMLIKDTIESNADADSIYLFADLGSAVISIDTVMDMIEDEALKKKCIYVDGPLVEGAFVGSVQCLVDPSPEAVLREVLQLKTISI
jgi:phosphoenolpyruvate---glycerone phosphotransferase subunit DhaM